MKFGHILCQDEGKDLNSVYEYALGDFQNNGIVLKDIHVTTTK